ncbi:MAG: murein biosynthesis integral membrane protein MurJ [Anaerolineales bacterium]|nr:murein biosynthesis integral membrane protein MurJ [Anaerolineales bacterium]
MTSTSTDSNRQIARAAGTVMVAFILSNLTGLLRQILIANAFGTQADIEAFNAANRVAETLFALVAGGALASAFIPTFTSLLTKDDNKGAWHLASSIFNLILLVISITSLIAAIFAPQVVRYVLAPGFADQPAKEALTIDLVRLMLPSAAIFALSGLVMGILNSYHKFFVPALAPSMYQIGMIFGVLVLSPSMGIIGLAWGVLIGASLHLLLQVPSLIRLGARYTPTLGLKTPAVHEVARLMGPRLLGVAVVQLNFWINIRLASQHPEGSVTGIVIAFALMLMPQAAIAQSIAIAAMPTFSAQYALGKLNEMRHSLASSLRGVLLLSLPASLGLILLRKPLIVLLYQRGEFDSRSTELVAWALLWYAVGLVGHSVVEIVSRAFYALHDTKTPVFVGIAAMSLNVVFSYAFSALFFRIGWLPHGGLALANSLATALEMLGLLYLMRGRLNGIEGKSLLVGGFQAVAGTAVMSIGLWFWLRQTTNLPDWQVVIGGIVIGATLYALAMLVLRVKEARSLTKAIQGRIKI